jgi:putative superfamily III holin-X
VKPPARDQHFERDRANPSPDWSALVARLVDSLSRIFRAEILLLERRLSENASAAIGTVVTRAAAILVLAATTIVGLICLLGGYILLLHTWLPAWQACGIGGLTIMVIGFLVFMLFNASARRRS